MENKKGITLIALVITVIVLLILAGVSISLVVGNNGILTQASNAVLETRKAEVREEVEMAWASAETDYYSEWAKDSSKVKNSIYYKGKIPTYLEGASVTDGESEGIYKVEYKDYVFNIDSTGRVSSSGTEASTSTSYVGYYIKKGNEYAIIYIDVVAQKKYSGGPLAAWAPVPDSVTEGKTFKTYVVTDTKYTDSNFGTNNVIEVLNSTGEDRFIAMALNDIDTDSHTWWKGLFNNSYSLGTSYQIGSGKTNTETVKNVWDNADSSSQNSTDVWNLITLNNGSADWFIPSCYEWAAFGTMSWTDSASIPVTRNITNSNYSSEFGLNKFYLSSSQYVSDTNQVMVTNFVNGYMGYVSVNYENVNGSVKVRLSTTF